MTLRKFLACLLSVFLIVSLAACQAANKASDTEETEKERSEYMSAIDAYYAAFQDSDFSQLQLSMPPQVLDALGLDAGELANSADNYTAVYGSDLTITVEENGSVELNETQLSDLSSYLKREYGISAKPEDGYLVEHTADFSGSLSSRSFTEGLVVYQLDGRWYLDILADSGIDSIRALYDQN